MNVVEWNQRIAELNRQKDCKEITRTQYEIRYIKMLEELLRKKPITTTGAKL